MGMTESKNTDSTESIAMWSNPVQYTKGEVRPSSLTYTFANDSPNVIIGHFHAGKIKLGREIRFMDKLFRKPVGQARFLHIRAKAIRRDGRCWLDLSQLGAMP